MPPTTALRTALLAIVPLAVAGCGDPSAPTLGDPSYEIVYVYTTGPTLAGDLYVITPDGRARRQLFASESYFAMTPAWSPDGRRVVFVGGPRNGNVSSLSFVNADGTGFEAVQTTFPAYSPEWSPDGGRLAVWYVADSFTWGTAIVNVDGSDLRPLEAASHWDRSRASWSPVADSVLLTAYSDLWLVDVAGTGGRVVASYATGGRWSPDRRQIAAWGRADTASTAAENLGLVVMNADGSGRRILSTIPGVELTWSPDGRRIAFVGERTLQPGEVVTDIYVVDASGGTPVNITRHQAGQRAFSPDWRPAPPAP